MTSVIRVIFVHFDNLNAILWKRYLRNVFPLRFHVNIKVGLCELDEQSPFIVLANRPTLISTWQLNGNTI